MQTAQPTNNGNVFRDAQPMQPVQPMMNIPPMQTVQPMQPVQPMQTQPMQPHPAALAKPKSVPQHRAMNSVQRGNDSVLNVLTGEPSPSQSYPASSNSSTKTSPQKEDLSQPGSANASIKPDDPFADMPDPFADISGNTFEDAAQPKTAAKPTQPQPAKVVPPANNDPFGDIGGSAFDDPLMSMAAPPATKKQPKVAAKAKPAVLEKQNSDNIILDMFAQAAPADPNHPKPAQAKAQKAAPSKAVDDNPFDAANPFGSTANVADSSNPFASVDNLADNPFGDSVEDLTADGADDNPFAMFTPMDNQSAKKKEDDPFMADRDPFADM